MKKQKTEKEGRFGGNLEAMGPLHLRVMKGDISPLHEKSLVSARAFFMSSLVGGWEGGSKANSLATRRMYIYYVRRLIINQNKEV